jgi:hypothetical protein
MLLIFSPKPPRPLTSILLYKDLRRSTMLETIPLPLRRCEDLGGVKISDVIEEAESGWS